jgi:hypothetical protein
MGRRVPTIRRADPNADFPSVLRAPRRRRHWVTGIYAERPVIAVAEVSAKFVAYGVNADGLPDMSQVVPDMRRSVWDLTPAESPAADR